MAGSMTNAWNKAVFDMLFDMFEEWRMAEPTHRRLPARPKDYVMSMLLDRFKRCRIHWRAARPHVNEMGVAETARELERRLSSNALASLKVARHNSRRGSVSLAVAGISCARSHPATEIQAANADRGR
jgi:hypothetical protein